MASKATPELQRAISRFDLGDASAAEEILARAELSDAVTVWHLLSRVAPERRDAVYARLDALVASPVEKEKAVALEKPALDAWWDAISVKQP